MKSGLTKPDPTPKPGPEDEPPPPGGCERPENDSTDSWFAFCECLYDYCIADVQDSQPWNVFSMVERRLSRISCDLDYPMPTPAPTPSPTPSPTPQPEDDYLDIVTGCMAQIEEIHPQLDGLDICVLLKSCYIDHGMPHDIAGQLYFDCLSTVGDLPGPEFQ